MNPESGPLQPEGSNRKPPEKSRQPRPVEKPQTGRRLTTDQKRQILELLKDNPDTEAIATQLGIKKKNIQNFIARERARRASDPDAEQIPNLKKGAKPGEMRSTVITERNAAATAAAERLKARAIELSTQGLSLEEIGARLYEETGVERSRRSIARFIQDPNSTRRTGSETDALAREIQALAKTMTYAQILALRPDLKTKANISKLVNRILPETNEE